MNGCARASVKDPYSAAPADVLLSPQPDFQVYRLRLPAEAVPSEGLKIRYLLDRIRDSKNSFMRNGESHNGRDASRWLGYKMVHWVQGVETAEDFVNRVASFSQKTGQPYLVRCADGKTYLLKNILRCELQTFEQHVRGNGTLENYLDVRRIQDSGLQ
ncbi:MAG: DUF5329 family protein [Candidatus Omnitrophica bacterium]|nr:DUF5329 family protein [Candidatus Omnitrophota bacterium]